MNRLTVDLVLNQALDLADLPTLDAHDRPSGPLIQNPFCLQWLQDALDLFHNQFPLAATVQSAALTIASNKASVPADFILDVKHGIVIPQAQNSTARRLIRTSYQKLLTYLTYSTGTGCPRRYAVMGPQILFWPIPDAGYAGTLNYYAMPAALALGIGQIPTFPSDQILIDCVMRRALEWARQEPAGTALKYARAEIAKIRAAGLFNQAEDTDIPLDPEQFVSADQSSWSWMGPFSQQN